VFYPDSPLGDDGALERDENRINIDDVDGVFPE
jgi:hypothetical protein